MEQTAVAFMVEQLNQSIGLTKFVDVCDEAYKNEILTIIKTAKEMEEKQSQDYAAFCINCDRKNYPIVDFESYLKL